MHRFVRSILMLFTMALLVLSTPVMLMAADTTELAGGMPDLSSLGTIAAIIAATLALVEVIKNWPLIDRLPTKAVSLVIGAVLTLFAYYTHQITGSLPWLIIQVVLGVVGASGVWQLARSGPK